MATQQDFLFKRSAYLDIILQQILIIPMNFNSNNQTQTGHTHNAREVEVIFSGYFQLSYCSLYTMQLCFLLLWRDYKSYIKCETVL